MGEIINICEKLKDRRRSATMNQPLSAEILFFTGVRYQKYADMAEMAVWVDPVDGTGPHNSGRKRRRRA